jgi:P27 family predicted phage terminase small subunit
MKHGMKGGRVPKPRAVKVLLGTAQPCRELPELPPGAPPCPTHLGPDARAVWREVVPRLMEIGTLASTDGGMLAMYCATMASVLQLRAIGEEQPILKTKSGSKVNPAIVEARKQAVVAERLASDLGLHYAARARTGGVPAPKDEAGKERIAEAERFIFGRQPFKVIDGGKAG